MRSIPILFLLLMTLAFPALAGDGVLEINQTCAVDTGCFAGDSPGLPVTIDGGAGKSYQLTSDLVVPNENTDGIQVGSDDVSIDLAGFEIRGPVVCSGSPLACTPNAGTGSGVEITSTLLSGISVRNGSVRGMGRIGVFVGPQSEVAQLRVRSNRLGGIATLNGSSVSGNLVYRNGTIGISVNSGSSVAGNAAYQNETVGILAQTGSTVSGNTAYLNGHDGIATSSGSTVVDNASFDNGRRGITAGFGSTISGNAVYSNQGDGILTGSGSMVSGNSVRSNAGFGLNLGSESGYRENVITTNAAGTVSGTGLVSLGNNACNGTATCP